MDDLLKQAEELGIKVDRRWTTETLAKKIDEALSDDVKEEPVTEKLFPVSLLKNYHPVNEFKIIGEDGARDPDDCEREKVMAGTTVLLDVEEAKTVIAKKIAERADAIG